MPFMRLDEGLAQAAFPLGACFLSSLQFRIQKTAKNY
jgi:hypothetical protein